VSARYTPTEQRIMQIMRVFRVTPDNLARELNVSVRSVYQHLYRLTQAGVVATQYHRHDRRRRIYVLVTDMDEE
jgi:DNA-binding MarR family transcriptional regulator